MIRTRFCVLATLALLGASTPVLAQGTPAVPADANKALWCATAFTLVEPQARAQGQGDAADNFHKYATTLSGAGHDSMIKAGFTEDQVKTQSATYTDKVNKELSGGGDQPEFSVVECTALVDPNAAAAIQSQDAAPAAPDAAAPAPDATAPSAPMAPMAPMAPAK